MEWKPIESAPRDGTAILIWQPDKDTLWDRRTHHMPDGALKPGEHTYKLNDPRLQWYDDHCYAIGYWRPYGNGSWGNRNSATVNPTHWMPLPTPPSTPE